MAHRHRPDRTSAPYPWVTCVAPDACRSARAHGNVIYRETCRCGTARSVEINGHASVASTWTEQEDPLQDSEEG